MNHTIKASIQETVSMLDVFSNFKMCVSGGAIRDLLHDKMPKDLDIEIFGLASDPCNNDFVVGEILEPILSHLDSLGVLYQVFTEYEGASLDAHVCFVVKLRLNNWYVDLILRRPFPDDEASLVSLYDMNLNQVTMRNGIISVHKPIFNASIVPTGKRISLSRLKHIQSKYPEYNFTAMLPYTYEEAELKEIN